MHGHFDSFDSSDSSRNELPMGVGGESLPVIHLNGAVPTLGLFSQLVVALETHGQCLIKGAAIAENPGASLLYMGALLANAGLPLPEVKREDWEAL
jgi:hypothetical protein